MVKKLLKSIFVLFVLAALFSGCASKTIQEDKAPVIESDSGAQEITTEAAEQEEVTSIVEDELIVDDAEVEIGDLI